MKRIIKNEYFLPVATVIILSVLSILIYLNAQKDISIINSISALSTLGLFILTVFYVIYTNQQIKELRKQRELQIQPLPTIKFVTGGIISPSLKTDPHAADILLTIDIPIKFKIKNVGNGAAILVDTYISYKGKKIRHRPQEYYANRELIIEKEQEIDSGYTLRDERFEIIQALSSQNDEIICRGKYFFDIILIANLLYKNVVGATFKLTIAYVVNIPRKSKTLLSSWIAAIDSFENKFITEIATYKTKYKRNPREAMNYVDEISNNFYKNCPIDIVEIDLLEIPESFSVKQVENPAKEYENIYYGMPLGHGKSNSKEFNKLAKQIKKRFATARNLKSKMRRK